jgi:hypothetical protein
MNEIREMKETTSRSDRWEKRRKQLNGSNALRFALILILFYMVQDLVNDIRTESSAFEIRFENDTLLESAGTFYRLYVNDEEYGDIDYNQYFRTDSNGNTDYKYCRLIDDASRLTYTLILAAMMFIVTLIADSAINSTPFTKKNIDRVKMIAGLQLCLGIFPGTVRLIMSFIRFNYYSTSFNESTLFFIAIAIVIAMIAVVFEKGLALQEDVDSIA